MISFLAALRETPRMSYASSRFASPFWLRTACSVNGERRCGIRPDGLATYRTMECEMTLFGYAVLCGSGEVASLRQARSVARRKSRYCVPGTKEATERSIWYQSARIRRSHRMSLCVPVRFAQCRSPPTPCPVFPQNKQRLYELIFLVYVRFRVSED